MARNITFCTIGIVLGILLGFFFANSGWVTPSPAVNGRGTSAPAQAPPLDPQRSNGPLPPGHPSVNDSTGDDRSGGAASSEQVQAAMDNADRNPKDFDAQMMAAATFYRAAALDKATIYLERALKLKPNDPDALTGMGHTKYDTGDFVGAATYYEKVLAQRPQDADVRTDFGNTYARRAKPDYDRAIAEYRKALEIDPQQEQALENLASALLRKGDKTAARTTLDRLAAVNPSNPAIASLRSNLDK